MKKTINKIVWSLLLCAGITPAQAQVQDYASKENKMYWRNRIPDANYWQQDIYYRINARIDEEEHAISANTTLEYVNNSPDTLHEVYFHLYQNAFVRGSYLYQLQKANKLNPRLGQREANGLGTIVENMRVNGLETPVELDNTIMKVPLATPLLPGAKAQFTFDFTTWWDNGGTRRRMQLLNSFGAKHYNGVQWFPKVCVYDRKMGWDTDQHLNKEFYGEFGLYDVTLDFPSNYIVEATGELQNRSTVLPEDLRDKLDVANFAAKPWNEKPSVIIPYVKGERKQWQFRAINVHDFAFTANPHYRIATTYWNGIECVGLVQEPHAAGWQNSAEYVAKIIRQFSEDFGKYQYPKMIAADANDGMEYPMLTLDGGKDPGYRGLLVHEIAHNWFYGMVGSNETYRAALDEGFTQFLTAWGLEKIDGPYLVQDTPKSWYKRRFAEPQLAREARVFGVYVQDALNNDDMPLNTHSHGFGGALGHENGYRSVYYKTAAMLYNLQYVLGDSLFDAAFRHYFKQWRFAHPYFEDFRASIIRFTKVDLNWFFDQWLESTRTIDYKVAAIRKGKEPDVYNIRLKRKGEMQMPIDFTVTAKDGKSYSYHIPNTYFQKKTEAAVLPQWLGWDVLNKEYMAQVTIPGGIKKVQIDTTFRLADKYQVNNTRTKCLPWSAGAFKIGWENGMHKSRDRRYYRLYARPDLWWNNVDGIKAGAYIEGNYLNTMHNFNAAVWYNTHLLMNASLRSLRGNVNRFYAPVNYTFNYSSPLSVNMPKLTWQINSRFLDGLWYQQLGLQLKHNINNTFSLSAKAMWRPDRYANDYLIYNNEWSSYKQNPNIALNAQWLHSYKTFNSSGFVKVNARAPFLGLTQQGSSDYSYAQVEAVNYKKLGQKLELRTRFVARYGQGNNIASESALFLAGANPEEMMEDKYTRSAGYIPGSWSGMDYYNTMHFQQGGGLNLRGYAGYMAPQVYNTAQSLLGYKGRSGVAINAELDFDRMINLKPGFTRKWLRADLYAFMDAGVIELSYAGPATQIWNTSPSGYWGDFRMDAGLGTALTIHSFGIFSQARPLTLRFDFPLYVNRPVLGNPKFFAPGFVFGINRSF